MSSARVLVAHPATQHSYQAAIALQRRGMLARYVTGLYFAPTGRLARALAALPRGLGHRALRQLRRRSLPGLDPALVTSFPLGDLSRVALSRLPARLHAVVSRRMTHSGYLRHFDRQAARVVRRERPDAVIGYDTAALGVFAAARQVGALCILDQTIGHPVSALEISAATGFRIPTDPELVARNTREAHEADLILAGSPYVRDSLLKVGIPSERIAVLPYGVDVQRFSPGPRRTSRFRLLYVGQINHRKGMWYLVEALKRLPPDVQLVLVGPAWGMDWIAEHGDRIVYIPQVAHQEVHEVFRDADLFVSASLHEGSALTIYEALASGLPVVATPNSGSVVRDGVDGFVVPVADVDALVDRVTRLYSSPELRSRMARSARERAEEYSWGHYHDRLAALVRGALDRGGAAATGAAHHPLTTEVAGNART